MIVPGQILRIIRPLEPFCEHTVDEDGLTYGCGPAGYDVRIANEICFVSGWHTFSLASTVEQFTMPNDLLGIVHDKSTWARRGLAVQNTVIEPGWRGYLTLELTFHAYGDLYIPVGAGIAQIIFHRLEEPTTLPYDGKYQDQEAGPQAAR